MEWIFIISTDFEIRLHGFHASLASVSGIERCCMRWKVCAFETNVINHNVISCFIACSSCYLHTLFCRRRFNWIFKLNSPNAWHWIIFVRPSLTIEPDEDGCVVNRGACSCDVSAKRNKKISIKQSISIYRLKKKWLWEMRICLLDNGLETQVYNGISYTVLHFVWCHLRAHVLHCSGPCSSVHCFHVMPSAGRWAIDQTSEWFLFAVPAAAAVRTNCFESIHLVNVWNVSMDKWVNRVYWPFVCGEQIVSH